MPIRFYLVCITDASEASRISRDIVGHDVDILEYALWRNYVWAITATPLDMHFFDSHNYFVVPIDDPMSLTTVSDNAANLFGMLLQKA